MNNTGGKKKGGQLARTKSGTSKYLEAETDKASKTMAKNEAAAVTGSMKALKKFKGKLRKTKKIKARKRPWETEKYASRVVPRRATVSFSPQ